LPYLRSRGRERFLRELQADGLSLREAITLIDRHEARLTSEELDNMLVDLAARSGTRRRGSH
jgi:hypothetical protein